MSDPVQVLLSRLEKPRANGRDRWRCACPVCGGKNRSTLSVGIGDNGCVLLKCWKEGCDPVAIASAIGLGVEDLFPPKDAQAPRLRRRHLITSGQALEVLEDEITLALVCASDMARGLVLSESLRERLMKGAARVALIREEVAA